MKPDRTTVKQDDGWGTTVHAQNLDDCIKQPIGSSSSPKSNVGDAQEVRLLKTAKGME